MGTQRQSSRVSSHYAPAARSRAADPPIVDLACIGSGATQHVFVRSGRTTARVVFKLPALFDELLPASPVGATLAAWQRRRLAGLAGAAGSGAAVHRRAITAAAAVGGWAIWQPMLAFYLRRRRIAAFREMLHALRQMAGAGVAGIVLPFRIVHHLAARLHLPCGTTRFYRGPVLIQRRADMFFEYAHDLDRFRWRDLVLAQEALWRCGFGIADAAAVFGPDGWALSNGRLYLADTGSITRSRVRATRMLGDVFFDSVSRRQRRRAGMHVPEDVDKYLDFVRTHLQPERVGRLWQTPDHGRIGEQPLRRV
jgi:hypothetical protein